MANGSQFTFVHISDLHFSGGTDQSNQNHAHSIELLVGIQEAIKEIPNIDVLIASGDISNKGDRQSLILASGWILGTIPIGAGEYTGLNMNPDRVGIVPGNHDAWNSGTDSGILLDRRQRSIENYNYAFPKHAIPESGCRYDWIEKEGHGIYIAYVDSCFLGDTDTDTESTFKTLRFDAMAKGKLTVTQTEQLLEWHDCGTRGLLQKKGAGGESIDKTMFSKSLKILVMHHYLFEPPEKKSDYFMKIQHRDIVFQNIALSDFDILLCGHKHIPSFDIHDYGRHFDQRAIQRHMMNYFRRLIGLSSLPIQFVDEKGKKLSKPLTQLAELVGSAFKYMKNGGGGSKEASTDELADNVFNLLKKGLDSPQSLKKDVERYLSEQGKNGTSMLEKDELKEIQKRISTGLSIPDRKKLRAVAEEVSSLSKRLRSRGFLQAMSGSSAKAGPKGELRRSFQVYQIDKAEGAWNVKCQRYDWIGDTFAALSVQRAHTFPQLP